MSIFKKIDNRLKDSSNWILNSSESLVILMLMATGMAFLFFGMLAIIFLNNRNWFLMILFGVFSLASLKQFIKIFKMVKKMGLKDALGGITAGEFVWKRDKNWKKISGGVEDGNGYEGNEVGSKRDAKENKRVREEIGHIYR